MSGYDQASKLEIVGAAPDSSDASGGTNRDWESEIARSLAGRDGKLNPTGKEWYPKYPEKIPVLSDEEWLALPELDAEILRNSLLHAGSGVDPSGLSIYGVRITGPLLLDDFQLEFPVQFSFVRFDEGVSMTMTSGPFIAVRDSLVVEGANFSHSALKQGLYLQGTEFRGDLLIENAHLGELAAQEIRLCNASNSESLQAAAPRISLRRSRVSGDCDLGYSGIGGGLAAVGLRVEGHLGLTGATLISCCADARCSDDGHIAVLLDAARIDSGIFMEMATIRGRFKALHAEIGGGVEAPDLTLLERGIPGESLISFAGSVVDGDIALDRLRAEGGLDLAGTKLGNLWLADAIILAGSAQAINLITTQVAMDCYFSRAVIVGHVSGGRGHFGGLLELDAVHIVGSVKFDLAAIGSIGAKRIAIHAANVLTTTGEFRSFAVLAEVAVHRRRSAKGVSTVLDTSLTGPAALKAAHKDWKTTVVKALTRQIVSRRRQGPDAFQTQQVLSFVGTKIDDYATFQFADVSGEVSFAGATVGGRLTLASAVPRGIAAARGRPSIRGNLILDRIQTKAGIEVHSEMPIRLDGKVSAIGAVIPGTFDLASIIFLEVSEDLASSPDPTAQLAPSSVGEVGAPSEIKRKIVVMPDPVPRADLRSAQLEHLMLCADSGIANLDGAKIQHLQMTGVDLAVAFGPRWRALPQVIQRWFTSVFPSRRRPQRNASGLASIAGTRELEVSRLTGIPDGDWKIVQQWLDESGAEERTSRKFFAQPWLAFANSFEASGHQSAARRLRFEATDRLMRHRTGVFAPLWRFVTRTTVGYGYRPWLALVWLGALWAIVFGLGWTFHDSFSPTDRSAAFAPVQQADASLAASVPAGDGNRVTGGSEPIPEAYPSFYAGLYAVDVVMPAIDTGQAAAWRVTDQSWLALVLTVFRGLSWGLFGLFVTGVAGLFKAK